MKTNISKSRWGYSGFLVLALQVLFLSSVQGQTGYKTVLKNGPSGNRVNMVFMGDGYTAGEIETSYVRDINATLTHMFNDGQDPYPRYRNFFNVYRVDLISNESGADVPPEGISRNTALDASYYYDKQNSNALYINKTKADAAMNQALAKAPFTPAVKMVTVNDSRYGGCGGSYAVYSASHAQGPEIALHEMGHAFNQLGDEYGGISSPYAGTEPGQANISKSSQGEKWSNWIGYDQPGIGRIGAYEGAGCYDKGLYRPSENSKMRTLGQPFDAVSREKIILDIYNLVRPLDAWLDTSKTLVNPESLWVDVVDPEVIKVEWFLDGSLIPGAADETFSPEAFGITSGTHQITARAYDPTDWVRSNLSELEESVSWNIKFASLQAMPEPSVIVFMITGSLFLLRRKIPKPKR
jgi:hypothetical protein